MNTDTSNLDPLSSCVANLEKLSKALDSNDTNQRSCQSISTSGIEVDFSRSGFSHAMLKEALRLAESRKLEHKIQQLLNGAIVNQTEDRPALHTSLRDIFSASTNVPDVYSDVKQTFERICAIATDIRNGLWVNTRGEPINNVINIGIGGSDLGPRFICDAFSTPTDKLTVHFVSNVDPVELNQVLAKCVPERTIVVIASKTFTTLETMQNAQAAKRWLLTHVDKSNLDKHLIATSTNHEDAAAFGVLPSNILPMWDWVGGRYSLWGAIGLPIAIALGAEAFRSLLKGAHEMDQHFANSHLEENLPVRLALLEFYYVNVLNAQSLAVLPYSHRLRQLPDFLQQLCMESNGKSVGVDGSQLSYSTSPIVWGSAGTVGQHSFHQLLHQGTPLIPIDIILPLRELDPNTSADDERHQHLVANALAQSEALANGKSLAEATDELICKGLNKEEATKLAPHKVIPGNRPHTLIGMETLSPQSLGALLAMYEHKVYVQSVLWDINAFDQWGVELGKQLSSNIFDALEKKTTLSDATSQHWVERYQSANASKPND